MLRLLLLPLLLVSARAEESAAPALKAESPEQGSWQSTKVASPHGTFEIEFSPGFEAAVHAIHERRRELYAASGLGRDHLAKANYDLRDDPDASMAIRIDERGRLLGAFKHYKPESPQSAQIWIYDLNDDGRTARVEISPRKFEREPGLVLSAYDKSGHLFSQLTVLAMDSHLLKERSADSQPAQEFESELDLSEEEAADLQE